MWADPNRKGEIRPVQQQWTPGVAQQWAPGAVTYMPAQAPTDVEWNITEEGGPLSQTGWSSWKKLPTGATTDTPAPVTFRNDLHLFVRGTDKSICNAADSIDWLAVGNANRHGTRRSAHA
jgi:hypothetical protein